MEAFAEALQALPEEWRERLVQQRLDAVPVMANLSVEELESVVGHMPQEVILLTRLAKSIELKQNLDLFRDGLVVHPSKRPPLSLSIVMESHRKPLKLPKKNPPILPKGSAVGTTQTSENPQGGGNHDKKVGHSRLPLGVVY